MTRIADDIWKHCFKAKNGCWDWSRGKDRDGYGKVWVSGKCVQAHRRVWEITSGPIPNGMFVLHHCDNPSCINPDHLWLGLDKDNTRDAAVKGRHKWPVLNGESNGQSKLKAEEVKTIRSLFRTGKYSQSEIAKAFNISPNHVSSIIRNVNWKCV